jgi:hypothetical protein
MGNVHGGRQPPLTTTGAGVGNIIQSAIGQGISAVNKGLGNRTRKKGPKKGETYNIYSYPTAYTPPPAVTTPPIPKWANLTESASALDMLNAVRQKMGLTALGSNAAVAGPNSGANVLAGLSSGSLTMQELLRNRMQRSPYHTVDRGRSHSYVSAGGAITDDVANRLRALQQAKVQQLVNTNKAVPDIAYGTSAMDAARGMVYNDTAGQYTYTYNGWVYRWNPTTGQFEIVGQAPTGGY